MFVSAFVVVADVATGSLSFANAGHPYPILLSQSTGTATVLDGECEHNGGVLGVSGDATFQAGRCPFVAGDRLLLFTDGLFEVHGGDGEILGIPGLLALAARRMHQPTDALIDDLVEAVRTFSPTGEFQDDVCLVGLEAGEELSTRWNEAEDRSSPNELEERY
jgi:serine phosphatase RsbU (regulator of sigma subunit)